MFLEPNLCLIDRPPSNEWTTNEYFVLFCVLYFSFGEVRLGITKRLGGALFLLSLSTVFYPRSNFFSARIPRCGWVCIQYECDEYVAYHVWKMSGSGGCVGYICVALFPHGGNVDVFPHFFSWVAF